MIYKAQIKYDDNGELEYTSTINSVDLPEENIPEEIKTLLTEGKIHASIFENERIVVFLHNNEKELHNFLIGINFRSPFTKKTIITL